jgi:hypothetical protein
MKRNSLRPKIQCEICNIKKKAILHRHHIVPRPDPRSTNSDNNLAILCPNCHSCVHTGEIVIVGIYDTTDGSQLLWFKNGEEPPLPKEFWKIKDNPLVITLNGEDDDYPERKKWYKHIKKRLNRKGLF